MIELERKGDLFTLTLCDGDNRFTLEFLEALGGKLDEVLEQVGDGAGGLIVTGQGKYWSNGIDLEALSQAPEQERDAFVPALHGMLGRLVTFPVPTVAALNGHSFAGGAILALAFDYRVMRTGRGWYCLPEIDLPMPFTEPMLALLKAKMRTEVLRDALLLGRRYTAEEALAAGLVDGVGEQEQLQALAEETLAPLAPKGRSIFKRFKQDLYGELAQGFGYEG